MDMDTKGVTVKSLTDRLGSSSVAFTRFSHAVYNNPNDLFCFFEGKDNPYYLPRIRKFTRRQIYSICCQGKKHVIRAYELIKNKANYNQYKKAFFVDRDFDIELNESMSIYETPCYSIENFYVSSKVFAEILECSYSISKSEEEFDVLVGLYIQKQKEFHNAVCLLNAWYACVRKKQQEENSEEKINLGEKLDKKLINFTLEEVTQVYNLNSLWELYPKAPKIPDETINLKYREFQRSRSKHKLYRGKWEVWFLGQFIELVNKHRNTLKLKRKLTLHGSLGNEKALSTFTSCAETPRCLRPYIRRILN